MNPYRKDLWWDHQRVLDGIRFPDYPEHNHPLNQKLLVPSYIGTLITGVVQHRARRLVTRQLSNVVVFEHKRVLFDLFIKDFVTPNPSRGITNILEARIKEYPG